MSRFPRNRLALGLEESYVRARSMSRFPRESEPVPPALGSQNSGNPKILGIQEFWESQNSGIPKIQEEEAPP